jgi:hypothetical protein
MRFLADMGISPRTVDYLREKGYEAMHLHELGQDRLPDGTILATALREKSPPHPLISGIRRRAPVAVRVNARRSLPWPTDSFALL